MIQDIWFASLIKWARLSDSAGTSVASYRLRFDEGGLISYITKGFAAAAGFFWAAMMMMAALSVSIIDWATNPAWLDWLADKYRWLTGSVFEAFPPMYLGIIALMVLATLIVIRPTVTASNGFTREDWNRGFGGLILMAASIVLTLNPFAILGWVMGLAYTAVNQFAVASGTDAALANGEGYRAALVDSMMRAPTMLVNYGHVLGDTCAQAWSKYQQGGALPACIGTSLPEPTPATLVVVGFTGAAVTLAFVFSVVVGWKFFKHFTVGVVELVALAFRCAGSILKRRQFDGIGDSFARGLGHIGMAMVVQLFALILPRFINMMVSNLKEDMGVLAAILLGLGYIISTGILVLATRKTSALTQALRADTNGVMANVTGFRDEYNGPSFSRMYRRNFGKEDRYRRAQEARDRKLQRSVMRGQYGEPAGHEGGLNTMGDSTPPPSLRVPNRETRGGKPVDGYAVSGFTSRLFRRGDRDGEAAQFVMSSEQATRTAAAPDSPEPGGDALRDVTPTPDIPPFVVLPGGALFDVRSDGPPTVENVARVMHRDSSPSESPMYGGRSPKTVLTDAVMDATEQVQQHAALYEARERLLEREKEYAARMAAMASPVTGIATKAAPSTPRKESRGAAQAEENRRGRGRHSAGPETPDARGSEGGALRRAAGHYTRVSGAAFTQTVKDYTAIRFPRLSRAARAAGAPVRAVNLMRGGSATRGDVGYTGLGSRNIEYAEAKRDLSATRARRRVTGRNHYVTPPRGDSRFKIGFTGDRRGSKVSAMYGVGFGDRIR